MSGPIAEATFTARRQRDWERLDILTRKAQDRGLKKLTFEEVAQVSPLYLDVCADLSRAQAARYGAQLVDYLQGLTAATHTVLYGSHAKNRIIAGRRAGRTLQAALEAFPRAVRRHKLAMLLAFLLFFVPFFGGLFASMADARFALNIVPESMLRPLVHAYREGFDAGRGASLDAAMAGFYVNNNVGIALRCFATGLAFGIGSAFYLVENGLMTGAIMGYVAAHGAGDNILTFVVSHGSLELGAIVLAGGAGLAMGGSLIAPGDRTRLDALQATAKSVAVIVFGAAVMLFMAAAVEGFWSASAVPSFVKRSVGVVIAASIALYITLAGRGEHDAGGAASGKGPTVDLIRARVAFRERALLDVLDLAVRFCASNAGIYARVSLATLVPGFVASWMAGKVGGPFLAWPVALALGAMADAPFVSLASRLVFADEARLRDVLSFRPIPRLIAVRLVQGFALLASSSMLMLPWLWLGGVLLFLPEVTILEGARLGASFSRAAAVASGRMGIAIAAMLLLTTLLVGATLIADVAGRELLENVLEFSPPASIFREGWSVLALAGFWSIVPIRSTIRFFVYLDIRTRVEGWDIQTRFSALAARDEGERASSVASVPPRAA